MTHADIYGSFRCIYSKCQQNAENPLRHPKIEYPSQLKGKGIR